MAIFNSDLYYAKHTFVDCAWYSTGLYFVALAGSADPAVEIGGWLLQ
jgi:hypothetical protein